ncbi:MAG: hypothetical protein J5750_04910 [Clostridiales bacterium]|nr:hypothetical protein [Clostridiales bacterium]
MAEMKCPLCSADMAFDDFTRAWVCPACGKSIAEKKEVQETTAAVAPASEPVVAPEPKAETPPPVEPAPSVAAEPVVPTMKSPATAAPVTAAPATKAPASISPFAKARTAPVPPPAKATAPGSDQSRPIFGSAGIEKAYAAIRNGQFEPAMKILSDLKKRKLQIARSTILSLFCSYRVTSTEELLKKLSGSAMNLKKFAERYEWSELSRALPQSRRAYISNIIEYCVIGIELTGDAKKIIQSSRRQPSSRPSTFAQMDKEEIRNEQRVKNLERSKQIEQMSVEEIAEDYDRRHPYYETPLQERGSIVGLAIDIIDLALDDGLARPTPSRRATWYSTYDPIEEPAPSTRVISSKSSSTGVAEALQKLQELGLPREELISRQAELITSINNLEKIILSDPGRN